MLINYFKIAYRHLLRYKTFSLINIIGLAVGLAACLLILQYVGFELSYDAFHQRRDRLYRIRTDKYKQGELIKQTVTTYPNVPAAMKRDYPEVGAYVRIAPWIADHTILKYGNKAVREKKLLFAEAAFFSLFSFPLLKGNPATALKEPRSIVLSQSRAFELFGRENPIGKTIIFEVNKPFLVTGIFKDVPPNSHIHFDMLVSYNTLVEWMPDYEDSWTFSEEVYAYLLLTPGANVEQLTGKLAHFSHRYYLGEKLTGMQETFILQPLEDIHLYSHYQDELGGNGNAAATWGLLGVAILIVVIAWCNYLNLSIAQYTQRFREIGVRKIVGATKRQLLAQFMVEAFTVSLMGFLLAIGLFVGLSPLFYQWLNLPEVGLTGSWIFGFPLWAVATTLFVLGVILSGMYPGLILSSFKPVTILKGKLQASGKSIPFGQALVVYQFVVTICLIAFTGVAYRQVRFMMQKELGVQIEGTLVVWGPMGIEWSEGFKKRMQSFEQEAGKLPQIYGVSSSKNVPGDRLETIYNVKLQGSSEQSALSSMWVGNNFFTTFGMQLVAGRDFMPTDSDVKRVILNESAVKLMGFKHAEEVIGKRVIMWEQESEIIGVVNDHHQQSLHNRIEPIVFGYGYGQDGYFSIKVDHSNLGETVSRVRSLYSHFFKGASFDFFFLEDHFNEQYQNEYVLSRVITFFSWLAISISCLGLWGLILHSVSSRTKEIGIRKVLGASVEGIVTLLSKDFLKLVLLAFVIAIPIGWYAISRWLESFAYQVTIPWWIFILSGLLTLLIAMLTISYQSFKAARMNPVNTLRNE